MDGSSGRLWVPEHSGEAKVSTGLPRREARTSQLRAAGGPGEAVGCVGTAGLWCRGSLGGSSARD